MKFKELREANLTKMQIKKVHDKADDLPKNDFIKRYGKEGDSVRFATATKMVKKELGIEDYEEGFKSDAQRKAAFASGYKEKGKKKDEAIKGNDFVGVSTSAREYIQGKQAAKDGKKYDDNPYKSGNREMNIRRLNWSAGHNKAREKDKDSEKSKKKEEVELDEVHFSNRNEPPAPKGMHKLRSGRDIPSTPQVDKIHKKVVAMTDRNDHSGARIEIAKACGDKKLVQIYNALELAHDNYSGAVGNGAIELRNKFSPVLNKAIERKFGKYADVIQDAL